MAPAGASAYGGLIVSGTTQYLVNPGTGLNG